MNVKTEQRRYTKEKYLRLETYFPLYTDAKLNTKRRFSV